MEDFNYRCNSESNPDRFPGPRSTGYREATELGDKGETCQSVGYDSGVCLSYYRSTDSAYLSTTADSIQDSLRDLNLGATDIDNPPAGDSRVRPEPPASVSDFCMEDTLHEQDEEGDTRLHLAIIRPDSSFAFHLIEMTRIPEYLDIQNKTYFHTPLHLAVITNQPLLVRALVISGASLTSRDRHGNTALHLACRQGSMDCIRQLTMPPSDDENKYVLSMSEARGLPVRLIKPMHGQDVCLLNYEGETGLHLAMSHAAEARVEIIDYLATYCGADINVEDGKCGYTLLHQAVKAKDLEMVQALLRYKQLAINQLCYSGNTARDIALSLNLLQIDVILQMSGGVCTAPVDYPDQLDDGQIDEFDDLTIGGLRLNQ